MYGDDLAYIHHVGFADFSLNAGPAILRMLARHGIRSGPVVDFGCGGGQWLHLLSESGYKAFGVDISQPLVQLATKTAPSANVECSSLWKCHIPACSAVTALGEVLSYLPPDASRPPSLRRLFLRVRTALAKNGLFVFDMLTTSNRKPMRYRTWNAGTDWAALVDVREDVAKGRLFRLITTFRQSDLAYSRTEERHVLRVVSRSDVLGLLRSVGFSASTSRGYGDFKVPPNRTVFCARRG